MLKLFKNGGFQLVKSFVVKKFKVQISAYIKNQLIYLQKKGAILAFSKPLGEPQKALG